MSTGFSIFAPFGGKLAIEANNRYPRALTVEVNSVDRSGKNTATAEMILYCGDGQEDLIADLTVAINRVVAFHARKAAAAKAAAKARAAADAGIMVIL